jgi:type I restriction enzyme S subunit
MIVLPQPSCHNRLKSLNSFSVSLLEAFERIAEPLLARMVTAAGGEEAVAALRDTLLPKLISGELRIEDAASQISAA